MQIPPFLEAFFQESIERFTLKNGLTVIVREDFSAQVISAQLWVKTGSIHEGALLGTGISHYVEHLLFKGTSKRTAHQINQEVQACGGYINAYTSFDRTVYHIDIPSEHGFTAVEILADIGFSSTFDPQETAREQSVILREIDMTLDDPDRQMAQTVFKTAYRQHAYKYPVIGLRPLFESLTHEQLFAFYKNHYVPSNMVLILTGAVSKHMLSEWAHTCFDAILLGNNVRSHLTREPTQLMHRTERMYGDYQITRGAMAFKIPGLAHMDAAALDVASIILGQGQSSILYQKLRQEQKLVHDIDASTWNPGMSGLFWIQYTCDADKREVVESNILDILTQAQSAVINTDQLQKATKQILVSEINACKTIQGKAARLGVHEVVIGEMGYSKSYLEKIYALDTSDINRVMHTHLQVSNLSSVSLEPLSRKTISVQAAPTTTKLPDFETHYLNNGTCILTQPFMAFPKVHIKVVFKGGQLYEAAHHYGITALLATMLTKDTHKRTALEVAEAIEAVGGTFSEFSGNNSFGFSIEVVSEDLPLALDILGQAMCTPSFLESTFNIEKESQAALVRESLDDVFTFSKTELKKRFFGAHPFSSSSIGSVDTIDSVQLFDLRKHFETLVCGANAVISVAGAFDVSALLKTLEHQLADLHTGNKPVPIVNTVTLPASCGSFQIYKDREQVILFQAYPDIGILDAQSETGEILNELFSGMSSNLFRRVREDLGLAYFVGSSRLNGLDTGMFSFYAGTHSEAYLEVFKQIQLEIERIQSGDLDTNELHRCKTRLIAQRHMSFQTLSARATDAAFTKLYGFEDNYWKTYAARIQSVTPAMIQAFAQKQFTAESMVKLVVLPETANISHAKEALDTP